MENSKLVKLSEMEARRALSKGSTLVVHTFNKLQCIWF